MNRCLVCNAIAFYPCQFCSQECEEQYNQLMEEIADNNESYNRECEEEVE